MTLLRSMKLYTVHVPSGVGDAQEQAVFLREGFSWAAFLFHFLWAFYHRLWLPGFMIMGVFMLFGIIQELGAISPSTLGVLQFGFLVVVGYHANDWLRAKLGTRGYVMADVTAADSLLRAEQRYFERVLHPAH
jgi:hypothetical protein